LGSFLSNDFRSVVVAFGVVVAGFAAFGAGFVFVAAFVAKDSVWLHDCFVLALGALFGLFERLELAVVETPFELFETSLANSVQDC
jgi:apolipoprotein N-acyltransferase